jgi:hypothetical protein
LKLFAGLDVCLSRVVAANAGIFPFHGTHVVSNPLAATENLVQPECSGSAIGEITGNEYVPSTVRRDAGGRS